MIFLKFYQLQRNHNQNREDFSFSRPWPWPCFLNGRNAAASIAPSLIRPALIVVQVWFTNARTVLKVKRQGHTAITRSACNLTRKCSLLVGQTEQSHTCCYLLTIFDHSVISFKPYSLDTHTYWTDCITWSTTTVVDRMYHNCGEGPYRRDHRGCVCCSYV